MTDPRVTPVRAESPEGEGRAAFVVHSAWHASGLVAGGGFGLVSWVLAAWFLDPVDYGSYALIAAWAQMASLPVLLLPLSLPVLHHGEHRGILSAAIGVSVALGVVSLLAGLLLLEFGTLPDAIGSDAVMATGFLVLILGQLTHAAGTCLTAKLEHDLAFRGLARIKIVVTVIQGTALIVLAHQGMGWLALVARELLGHVLTPILTAAAVGPNRLGAPGLGDLRTVLKGGVAFLPTRLNQPLTEFADALIVAPLGGIEVLGLFLQARRIAGYAQQLLSPLVGPVSRASYSRLRGDPAGLEDLRGFLAHATLALSLPVAVALALCPETLVVGVLGPRWVAVIPGLIGMSLHVCFINLTRLGRAEAAGRDEPLDLLFGGCGLLAVYYVSLIMLVPSHGVFGAAVAMGLGSAAESVVYQLRGKPLLSRESLKPILWVLLAWGAAVCLMSPDREVARLLMTLVVYGVLVWWFSPGRLREAIRPMTRQIREALGWRGLETRNDV